MSQTILITGASSGMGRDMAEYFAGLGWNVAATMRDPDDGAELAAHDTVEVLRLDVTDRDSIEAAVAATLERFGGIDVLVNNAGFGVVGPVEGATEDEIDRQIAVNLRGPISTIRAVLPHMRAARAGTIVNVTSVGGRVTLPMNALYHATKWGLEGLTESMAFELAPLGIRVKLIEPGGTKTDFVDRSLTTTDVGDAPEYEAMRDALMAAFQTRMEDWNPPRGVSETVHRAVTDGTDRLRYPVGEDARGMLEMRAGTTDEEWIGGMRAQFGLAGAPED